MTTGGTGLGLYIARQLATAMGGTLQCSSTLGTGSVFRFTLQRAAVAVPVQLAGHLVPEARGDAAEARDARLQAS